MDTTPCLREGCGAGWGGGDQRHSRGKDAGGREPRGTDGWKRLKERRIVRVEQTGPQKGDGSRGGNGGLRKERD